jgi:MFS family permease
MQPAPAQLPTRSENRLLIIHFFTWGSVFLCRMSQLYLAPFIAPEFHLNNEQIGLLASVLAITWAISGLVFGFVSDRIGRRRILVPAVLAFSLLSWCSGLARNFGELLVVRALMGIAEGPCWAVITALVEESSAAGRRGRNVGFVVSAGALVGLAVAPVLTTQIASRFDWRWAFFAAGVPGFVLAFLIQRFVGEPVRTEAGHGRINIGGMLRILRYRNMALSCVGAVGFVSWLLMQNIFAPLYITEVAHQPATGAGLLLGATGLGSFVLGLFLPALSDRFGRRRTLAVMAVLSFLVPVALLTPSLYGNLWLLAGILFITNAGQGIPSLVMVLIPTESVPARYAASSIGLATFTGEVLGAAVAPAVGGALAVRYGLGVPMWMSAAGAGLVLVASVAMRETGERPD